MYFFNANLEGVFFLFLKVEWLKTFIDEKLPTKNIAYAIKIEGLFSYVKTRSEPKQTKPYAKLKEVLKKQDKNDDEIIELQEKAYL